jgi:hypothetical protein
MFHVKHFGTIAESKALKANVLSLEASGIAQNNCKFGARTIATQVEDFIDAYR